jgi:hypothetical protein
LDWFQEKSFAELDASEKQLVLQYFTAIEFDEMHHTIHQIKSNKTNPNLKADLLKQFDKKHNERGIISFPSQSIIWKAAMIILLIGVSVMQFKIFTANNSTPSATSAIHDTITYVKNIVSEPIKIHDTVFVKYNSYSQKESSVNTMEDEFDYNYDTSSTIAKLTSDIHVLSIASLQSNVNKHRNSSIKNDSLINQFGFVTM